MLWFFSINFISTVRGGVGGGRVFCNWSCNPSQDSVLESLEN